MKTLELNPCCSSGSGVHRFVFYAACKAVDEGLTDQEAEPLIRAAMTRNPNPASEITDALRSARREERVPSQIWAPKDDIKIKEILATPDREINAVNTFMSPIYPNPHPELFLDQLFPGDPLLCMGKTNYIFDTKLRSEWRGFEKFQSLIVPSPMIARKGKTKLGNMSAHSIDNTGERHYLVLEFDTGGMRDHWKLLFYLAKQMPLVLICSSGGKSLHGWFNVQKVEGLKISIFMQAAAALGADTRTFLPSQFIRLPDGQRYETKARQSCVYFDSEQL